MLFRSQKGKTITGLTRETNCMVFHAGTRSDGEEIQTSGGRVFAITSFGNSINDATSKSFSCAEKINYEGKYYRSDIGKDLI